MAREGDVVLITGKDDISQFSLVLYLFLFLLLFRHSTCFQFWQKTSRNEQNQMCESKRREDDFFFAGRENQFLKQNWFFDIDIRTIASFASGKFLHKERL